MSLLLLFLFPLVEIFLLLHLIELFSFLEVLAYVVISGALGFFIMAAQGRAVFGAAQSSFGRGEMPPKEVLHRALIFLGGFFLLMPGVLTDVLGLLLVLPGFRHALVWYGRVKLAKGLKNGSVHIFSGGLGGFSFSGHAGGFSQASEREAKIVDVKVLESSSTPIE